MKKENPTVLYFIRETLQIENTVLLYFEGI